MRTIETVLQDIFNLKALRQNQVEIVHKIMDGEDVLVLLPTGAGKSLTFQLPMVVQNKKTIVISPLIALMEDQVMQLKIKKIKACCIHSYLDLEDRQLILSQIDQFDFIYCSPEWLATNGMEYLKNYPCEAIVIDEAHCISEWGFEFRPHYLCIDEVITYFNAQVIALTATANTQIIADIQEVVKKDLVILDFLTERDNIFLSVVKIESDNDKLDFIIDTLKTSGPTVIYFSSKKQVEAVYEALLSHHILAERYHADMTYENRMSVQQRYMQDEIQVICATNAFGMGVNKSNIRTVIHYHMPKSIFQFIQEIGRGGRDGKLCQSILLYKQNDEQLSYRLNEMNELLIEEIDLFYKGVQLPEEKHLLMNILSKKYNQNIIVQKIKQHQNLKRQSTAMMLEYIQEKSCLNDCINRFNQNTYNTEFKNHLTIRKNHNLRKCCMSCNDIYTISFEQVNYDVQKKFKKTLLNQLFNDLYDFT
ncbi:RecQ family ATP-dependent DNA helicase [Macrococcus animalis]|uniref:RecQ family ATP-dependent DNA helicase n=1 Tax=Macrococcus animalis TaxID=3395467 RepID=UPI0039BDB036